VLTARTRLLGVIGWPVAHSLSPLMHGTAFPLLGLDWAYAAFAVLEGELAAAVAGARALGFRGLNVTLPHKEAALALCQPDALSRRVGAVNTLSFTPAGVLGYNTDVHGFRMLCAESGAPLCPGQTALVLGAGGAARAAALVLRDAGVALHMASRTRRTLAVDGAVLPVLPPHREALAPLLSACDLVVDCTGRGLLAQADYPELDLALLPRRCVVLDLVVRRETPLLARCAAQGLAARNGAAMLLHQGVKALSIWCGAEIPDEVVAAMRAALLSSAP
jgi:shikimate dehydrogenase